MSNESIKGAGFGGKNGFHYCYCKEMVDYFLQKIPYTIYITKSETPRIIPNEFPTFEVFATRIGVHYSMFKQWAEKHPAFGEAYEICRQAQRNFIIQNGLNGAYNAAFARFYAISCLDWVQGEGDDGLTEKSDLEKMQEYFPAEIEELGGG